VFFKSLSFKFEIQSVWKKILQVIEGFMKFEKVCEREFFKLLRVSTFKFEVCARKVFQVVESFKFQVCQR